MKIVRQKRANVGIDMSPLIDCVFQLLVFFMLSSTFLVPMMELNLPTAGTEDTTDPADVVVTITKDGHCFVNDREVLIDHLKDAIEVVAAESGAKSLTIRGDEEMPYRLFVEVLDVARGTSIKHINIAHEGVE